MVLGWHDSSLKDPRSKSRCSILGSITNTFHVHSNGLWLGIPHEGIRHTPMCKHRLEFTVNSVTIVTITVLSHLILVKIIFFCLWNILSVKKQQKIIMIIFFVRYHFLFPT